MCKINRLNFCGFLLTIFVSAQSLAVDDPTRPDGFIIDEKNVKNKYLLQSVFISDSRKVAIINGESFREGDSLAIGKVINIDSQQVIIQKVTDQKNSGQGNKKVVLKIDKLPTVKQYTESNR